MIRLNAGTTKSQRYDNRYRTAQRQAGRIVLTARGKGLKAGKIVIKAEKPFLVSGLRQNTFQVSNCLTY